MATPEVIEVEEGDNAGEYLVGALLIYNAALFDDYLQKLFGLYTPMMQDYRRSVLRITTRYKKHHVSQLDAVAQLDDVIKKLDAKYEAQFKVFADTFGPQYAKAQSKEAKIKVTRGYAQFNVPAPKMTPNLGDLKALEGLSVLAMSGMISSGQRFYSEKITYMVTTSMKAENVDSLPEYFDKQEGITDRWVKGKFGDNYRQDFNAYCRDFMEGLGLKFFMWDHTDRAMTPRRFHKYHLNNKVYRLNRPPIIDEKTKQRGYPGDLWACQCRMRMLKKL